MPEKARFLIAWDLLRNTDLGLPNVDMVARWCRDLLEPIVSFHSLPICAVTTEGQGGIFPTKRFVHACGVPCDEKAWERLFLCTNLPPAARAILDEYFGDAIVVGALAPFLAAHLQDRGQLFIDLELDPIRFAKDLFFRARTNDPHLAGLLDASHVSDSFIRREAAFLRSRLGWHGPQFNFLDHPSVGLFIGQTSLDASLLSDNGLLAPVDFLDEIRDSLSDCSLTLIVPHPYARNSGHLDCIRDVIPSAVYCGINTYALLNHPLVSKVVTLSSSVSFEAPYFGKEAYRLAPFTYMWLDKLIPGTCQNIRISATDFLDCLSAWLGEEPQQHHPVTQHYNLRDTWNHHYSLGLDENGGFARLVPGSAIECRYLHPSRGIFARGDFSSDASGVWFRSGWGSILLQIVGVPEVELTIQSPTPQQISVLNGPALSLEIPDQPYKVTVPVTQGFCEFELKGPEQFALLRIEAVLH